MSNSTKRESDILLFFKSLRFIFLWSVGIGYLLLTDLTIAVKSSNENGIALLLDAPILE